MREDTWRIGGCILPNSLASNGPRRYVSLQPSNLELLFDSTVFVGALEPA